MLSYRIFVRFFFKWLEQLQLMYYIVKFSYSIVFGYVDLLVRILFLLFVFGTWTTYTLRVHLSTLVFFLLNHIYTHVVVKLRLFHMYFNQKYVCKFWRSLYYKNSTI